MACLLLRCTPPAPRACLPVCPRLLRRGLKDMNIPLLGSLAYLGALVGTDLLLLWGSPAMGIEGAGYAAAVAQWVGAATVCALLARKQVRGWRAQTLVPRCSLPQGALLVPAVALAGTHPTYHPCPFVVPPALPLPPAPSRCLMCATWRAFPAPPRFSPMPACSAAWLSTTCLPCCQPWWPQPWPRGWGLSTWGPTPSCASSWASGCRWVGGWVRRWGLLEVTRAGAGRHCCMCLAVCHICLTSY